MTDRRTDGLTDKRTDGRTWKNNMSPNPSGVDIICQYAFGSFITRMDDKQITLSIRQRVITRVIQFKFNGLY